MDLTSESFAPNYQWQSGKAITIQVSEAIAYEVIKYARQLDNKIAVIQILESANKLPDEQGEAMQEKIREAIELLEKMKEDN